MKIFNFFLLLSTSIFSSARASSTILRGNDKDLGAAMTEEDLKHSIFVPNDHIAEFERMMVAPLDEQNLMDRARNLRRFDFAYNTDRYCRRAGHGGHYYRKLSVDESKLEPLEQSMEQNSIGEIEIDSNGNHRELYGHGYGGGYGGLKYCWRYTYWICCYGRRKEYYPYGLH
mmetsp:Transcript_9962/g.14911  ORF Transcript_9962/g.14911 Transcript_9962/m.14911 type:complete len:172 (-) Transcript_9962:7-522(-)